jgi:DNA polymerase IV
VRRTVCFIDFNSYFAAVEQHANPLLRGKPVAVIASMTDSTCCIAASREAKRFGVKTGTSVREARARCPGLRFVLSDAAKYMDYHRRLVALLEEEIPVEKVCSVDELYGVFTGTYAEKERLWPIALQVKRRLAQCFGDPLTCSIGLAPTVFLAKTASDMRKPDGLVWLDAEAPGPEFFSLELRDLCGIGANMHERLKIRGIRTVKALWEATPQQLRAVWGGIEGERFWQALHGIEPVRPEITPRQIGHSKILHPDLRHEDGARAMLDRLVYKAALRLRKEGYECGEMHVSVKRNREFAQQSWAMMARFPSTQEVRPLLEVWRSMWHERPRPLSHPFAVAVDLCRLLPDGDPRLPLFAPDVRDEAVSRLLDQVAKRHGSKALWFGSAHEAVKEDVPRIAFQSLPDV